MKKLFYLFLVNGAFTLSFYMFLKLMNFLHIENTIFDNLNILLFFLGSLVWSSIFILYKNYQNKKFIKQKQFSNNYKAILDKLNNDPDIKAINRKQKIKIKIYESEEFNAFAFGFFQNRSIIGISSNLLNILIYNELKSVILHEFAHIKNDDNAKSLILQESINSYFIIFDYLIDFIFFFLGNRICYLTNRISNIFKSLLRYSIAFFSQMLLLFISRKNEFNADQFSCKIIGTPIFLMKTLSKLSEISQNQTIESNLHSFNSNYFSDLVSTHPTFSKRIKKIENKFL